MEKQRTRKSIEWKLIQPDPALWPAAVDTYLQPQTMEQLSTVIGTDWSNSEWRIVGGYKLRCIAPCRGHVGYVLDGITTPLPEHAILGWTVEEMRAERELARKALPTERLRAYGQGFEFWPLPGWTQRDTGLWVMTKRAQDQARRGYGPTARRPTVDHYHPAPQDSDRPRERLPRQVLTDGYVRDRFYSPTEMLVFGGQPLHVESFPQFARCPVRGCWKVLRIRPPQAT